MGLEPSVVERTTLEKISTTGSGYSSLEALMEDCFNNAPLSDAATAQEQGTVGSQHKQTLVDYTEHSLGGSNFQYEQTHFDLPPPLFLPEEDQLEKLQKLQREKQCKICMDRDIAIVLIPCGHLVTCQECSVTLTKCPICCGSITQKIKTYNA